jgi:hypothetical protein
VAEQVSGLLVRPRSFPARNTNKGGEILFDLGNMHLKDISLGTFPNGKYQDLGFNWDTHCIEDLYLRNLLPYKNNFIRKLNIVLVGEADKELFSRTDLPIGEFNNDGLSIGEVLLHFDFEAYYGKDEYGKKLDMLNKIQEGFEIFSKQTKSDPTPFKFAYQKCVDQKLVNEYVYKEAFSKNRKYKVQVFIKVDIKKLEVVGVFLDKEGNKVSETIFFTRKPDALYHYYLGNVKWVNENQVTLYGRSKEEHWEAEINQ